MASCKTRLDQQIKIDIIIDVPMVYFTNMINIIICFAKLLIKRVYKSIYYYMLKEYKN